jgi:hypothetical protein
MASIILVTIDFLACGFFIYVLLKWTRETNRKPSPSRANGTDSYSIRPAQPSLPRHQQKKTVPITTIKEISHYKQTAPRKTFSIP